MLKVLSKPNSNSTSGERSFFYRIENYFAEKSGVYLYFEPDINTLRPDFLLLSPNFGVIIIEVKDYSQKNLKTISKSGSWEIFKEKSTILVSNPFDQTYQYWRAIKNKIDHSDFPEEIEIPIIRIVAFSNISEDSRIAKTINLLAPKHVLLCFQGVLSRNENFHHFFNDLIPLKFELESNYFKILRANIIPTCRLPVIGQENLNTFIKPEDKVKLLDEKQEELARDLGEGHRLIFGVAGSGKTVLLIARARYLALHHPEWKILILCYNRLLKNLLFHLLNPQDYEADITITTYHSWARHYLLSENDHFSKLYEEGEKNAKKKGKISIFFQDFVPNLLIDKLKAESEKKVLYDAILIDEAQDFEEDWFRSIIPLLNPETNTLLITCDGLQGIYARKRFTWSSVGIQARGRVRRFEKSYRTPIEIGEVAQKILPESLTNLIGQFDEFLPTKAFIGKQGIVEIILSDSRNDEYMKLTEKIDRLLKQDAKILILFKKNLAKRGFEHPLFKFFKNFNIEWKDLEKYNYESPGVLIGTLHGTKGLEFDTIIIPELDTYTSDKERQLLYVGVTRSKERLILSGNQSNGSNKFIEIIKPLQT
ncbi:MAG: AAA family ATPase [Candidatus Lokiarchaeota archaeon]|nr:AAA family ATPase [Candidatus Lokiarchaeota archaeon]